VNERVVRPAHLCSRCIQGLQVGVSLPGQHHLQRLKKLIDLPSVLHHKTLTAHLLLLQPLPQLTHLTAGQRPVNTGTLAFLGFFKGTCIYIRYSGVSFHPNRSTERPHPQGSLPVPISAQRGWPAVAMESVFLC